MVTIAEVFTTIHNPAPPSWREQLAQLSQRRRVIDDALEHGLYAYGFTTRLGHRDDEPHANEYQLLREHLLGPVSDIPDPLARLMISTLVQQTLTSPSGAPPSTVSALIDLLDQVEPLRFYGNWTASYGAGDVVPAAWLAECALGERQGLPAGTTISLINGRHISTAFGIATAAHAGRTLAQALSIVVNETRRRGGRLPAPFPCQATLLSSQPQLPISLRDSSPVVEAVECALISVERSLTRRLSSPSGNPLFSLEPSVRSLSQSSFLDFTLTMAMQQLATATRILGGALHRTHVHLSDSDPSVPIQVPKVMHSILDAMTTAHASGAAFSSGDSDGVEDMRDMSMLTTLSTARVVSLLNRMMDVDGALHPDPVDRTVLSSLLLDDALGIPAEQADAAGSDLSTVGQWMAAQT